MSVDRPRPLVAGNWKMNGLKASLRVLEEVRDGYAPALQAAIDLLVCPPATLIQSFARATAGTRIAIGAQDAHAEPHGAYTGDIAAEMVADAGATFVILGHSERRTYHAETDAEVCAKAKAAHRAGLVALICVGETQEERSAGRTLDRVREQVRGSLPQGVRAADTVIAYEPVWAIGTGLTPTTADVAEVHALIRDELRQLDGGEGTGIRILYGGSVKPANARDLLSVANVDGALVGGASLVARDFLAIAGAYLG
jgi:triosephosphate isomerase